MNREEKTEWDLLFHFTKGDFYVHIRSITLSGLDYIRVMMPRYCTEKYVMVDEIPSLPYTYVFGKNDDYRINCYSSNVLNDDNKEFKNFWQEMWSILLK